MSEMRFLETLRRLPLQRQLILGGAVISVVLAMSFLFRGALKDPFTLLYAGLEPRKAGEIIQALDQGNIPYEIMDGSIFVPHELRDEVRFTLAQDGLPRQSVQGYELLDNVNGFSVTSEMYKASYWRAKEGELTRTILAIPGVDAARVHIGANLRTGFARSSTAPTASVTLSTVRDLSQGQAEAIQFLVALAVAGLNPDDVAVIDSDKGIIAGPNAGDTPSPRLAAEDMASAVEVKVAQLLEARVGSGNVRVSVSVDVTRDVERISEVRFDPESRVVRQRTTSDMNDTSAGSGQPGALTVASNLPVEGGQGGTRSSSRKNSSETIAYELNEVRTETQRLPGEVRRMSIAVLVNEKALNIDAATADAAQQLELLATEFQELISSAAGLDPGRGDSVTVEMMPFSEPALDQDLQSSPGLIERLFERHMWQALQAVLLLVVVLALGFGVIRPVLSPGSTAQGKSEKDRSQDDDTLDEALATEPFEFLKNYTRDREDQAAAVLQDWLNDERKVAVNE
ncbi:MAG: flagellar basal-body MS-ring/collar protein FliF [Pseudomonadota bacterium]